MLDTYDRLKRDALLNQHRPTKLIRLTYELYIYALDKELSDHLRLVRKRSGLCAFLKGFLDEFLGELEVSKAVARHSALLHEEFGDSRYPFGELEYRVGNKIGTQDLDSKRLAWIGRVLNSSFGQ